MAQARSVFGKKENVPTAEVEGKAEGGPAQDLCILASIPNSMHRNFSRNGREGREELLARSDPKRSVRAPPPDDDCSTGAIGPSRPLRPSREARLLELQKQ